MLRKYFCATKAILSHRIQFAVMAVFLCKLVEEFGWLILYLIFFLMVMDIFYWKFQLVLQRELDSVIVLLIKSL